MRIILVLCAALFICGCGVFVNDDATVNAVENQGYSEVQIVSKHVFIPAFCGCGNDDDAAYDMIANNPVGKQVKIVVCAGWPFKGVTVRTK